MKTKSLELALGKLYDKLQSWIEGIFEILPNLLLAIVVIFLIHILVKIFKKNGEKILIKVSKNVTVAKLIIRILSVIMLVAGFFIALGILHLDKTVTSLLAGVGILGLAFSFAFQHTAANILAGIIISLRSSVDIGDLIRTNDHFGNVLEVGLRTTKIVNVTGQHVEIPNRLVMDNPFMEYSQTQFRRIDIVGKMDFREDLTSIRKMIENEMATFEFIYPDKSPNMVYNELDFEKVNFTLRVWMNFTNNDGEFLNARSACIEKLGKVLKDNNVTLSPKELNINN